MITIAVPNKGALSDAAVNLIKEAGYKCKRSSRELVVRDAANNMEFFFLRPRDIAIYVTNGILDMGITGMDLALDSKADVEELLPLNFGNSSFFYAVKKDSGLTPDKFDGKRIATSYPNIVKNDLEIRGVEAEVVKLDGAVEISIELGVADAIADVVESGRTLVEAGLATVGDPIMESEAVVIARDKKIAEKKEVETFLKRLNGIIVAREYVMIEYDVKKDLLDKCCAITPGIEAPTISPLNEENWVAVKSMTKKKTINDIIDQLSDIGAKGIIATEIKTCRI